MKKILLLTTGYLCLALGIIGIAIPVLPTTPFILLASGCFAVSSPKVNSRLLKTKHLGTLIKNYRDKTGIPVSTKVVVLTALWCLMCVSMLIVINIIMHTSLTIIGIAVSLHILCIKTKRGVKMQNNDQKFFKCNHCGNIIGLIINHGVPLVCCEEKMIELIPNSTEASHEKHLPIVDVDGDTINVTVGATMHPHTDEHHINFIYLETQRGGQRKNVENSPTSCFKVADDKPLRVFAYCNLHGLFATEIK